MPETWYRGTSSLSKATPGSDVGGHDLGDGMYYSNEISIAREYAALRASESGGKPIIVQVQVDSGTLGRVLDLRNDVRWQAFLNAPMGPMKARDLITGANQNYNPLFLSFARSNNIDLGRYDAIIADEFVRGGHQLCVLSNGGKLSPIAEALIKQWKAIPNPGAVATQMPYRYTGIVFKRNRGSRRFDAYVRKSTKRIANSRGGWAAFAEGLGQVALAWGDRMIQLRLRERIENFEPYIRSAADRQLGVLIIAQLQEWAVADYNGNRARSLLYVHAMEGTSPEAALEKWSAQPHMLAAPREGWRYGDPMHVWIAVA